MLAVVVALAQLGLEQRRIFFRQQPCLHALRLHVHRPQHSLRFRTPAWAVETDYPYAEGMCLSFAVDESIDHFADDCLRFGRMVNAQSYAQSAVSTAAASPCQAS